jgi:hypothetical protein
MLSKFGVRRHFFGNYRETKPVDKEKLTISVSPATFPLKWGLCALSANYLADYFVHFYPAAKEDPQIAQTIKHSISFVANELMENAVKYHYNRATSINLTTWLDGEDIFFLCQNTVDPKSLAKFFAHLEKMTSRDPHELLIEQIEKNAEGTNEGGSGLGILTMMTDYQARFGWKVERNRLHPNLITVTTFVELPLSKEINGNGD